MKFSVGSITMFAAESTIFCWLRRYKVLQSSQEDAQAQRHKDLLQLERPLVHAGSTLQNWTRNSTKSWENHDFSASKMVEHWDLNSENRGRTRGISCWLMIIGYYRHFTGILSMNISWYVCENKRWMMVGWWLYGIILPNMDCNTYFFRQ